MTGSGSQASLENRWLLAEKRAVCWIGSEPEAPHTSTYFAACCQAMAYAMSAVVVALSVLRGKKWFLVRRSASFGVVGA